MFKKLRAFHTLVVLLISGSLFTSCLFDSEETDYTLYNDCILSAISFGTIPRTVHTINATTGKDSTYQSTVAAGSVYPFTIDQINNIAYNLDSLPYGCDASRIIFETFKVSEGTAVIRKMTADEDTLYSLTDTLDFSRGSRQFTLYGYDKSPRKYTVEVRIHQESEDALIWNHWSYDDWTNKNFTSNSGLADYEISPYHFRLENGKLMVSTDGENYAEDSVPADDLTELPTSNFAWASSKTRVSNDNVEVLLYGTVNEGDALSSRMWRRVIDLTGRYTYSWDYLVASEENKYPAAVLRDASLLPYDQGYLLVGIDESNKISVKYSKDGGRIWKDHEYLVLPEDLEDVTVSSLKAAVDENSNLWLLLDGKEVWVGRSCKVGWAENQKAFY